MMGGVVVSQLGVETKQPNSGIRKCVRVMLKRTGEIVTAFVPGDGGLNWVSENDEVDLVGFGNGGKAKGDLVGTKYQV